MHFVVRRTEVMVEMAFFIECRLCRCEIVEFELQVRFWDVLSESGCYVVVGPADVFDVEHILVISATECVGTC